MLKKDEYFKSPVYSETRSEWVDKLNNLCDPYIVKAREVHQRFPKLQIFSKQHHKVIPNKTLVNEEILSEKDIRMILVKHIIVSH